MKEHILIQGGFYRHYKYDPSGALGNSVYEVLRVTYNFDTSKCRVVYRPLYRLEIEGSVNPWLDRPVEEWFEPAMVEGKEVERYQFINTLQEVEKLEKLLLEQYFDDIILLQRNRAIKVLL